jgi:glutaconate CoA-transferase subunit A
VSTRIDKIIELERLPEIVPSGSTIALGGGWFANHPMAAVRQLLRANRDDLKVLALLGTIDVDLLIGAKALRHLTFSMVTLEAYGLAQQFRRAVQTGELSITELPALSLQVALEAAGQEVPFLPLRGPIGSDLVGAHPETFGIASSSFGDEDVMVVKAQFEGTYAQDPELAAASDLVIVTCEEIVDVAETARNVNTTRIPGYLVDAVIEAPFGAHPCSHVPRYAQDAWEILTYQRTSVAGGEGYDAYVAQLRGETEDEYRERVLGDGRAAVLTALAESGRTIEVPA